jgi:hypothetical protein
MEKLNNFLSRYKEYDYILIELFGIEQNKQVCISFFSIADDNILMLKYKESSRAQLIRILEELNQQKEIHLSAIINQYDPDFI